MAVPCVYTAITAITAELSRAGIPKSRRNEIDDYHYRSIDDVTRALSPLLAEYGLCVLPKVTKRIVSQLHGGEGGEQLRVTLRVMFDLVSSNDGSAHRIQTVGEALDDGDKATAKAMTAAYKSAMTQVFCIPAGPSEDPDVSGPHSRLASHLCEPVQGWDQWVVDIGEIVGSCETDQAIDLVQRGKRELLAGLNRERPDLYSALGCVFTKRREDLKDRSRPSGPDATAPSSRKTSKPRRSKQAADA